jgi:hypothetical protein
MGQHTRPTSTCIHMIALHCIHAMFVHATPATLVLMQTEINVAGIDLRRNRLA